MDSLNITPSGTADGKRGLPMDSLFHNPTSYTTLLMHQHDSISPGAATGLAPGSGDNSLPPFPQGDYQDISESAIGLDISNNPVLLHPQTQASSHQSSTAGNR